jgi:predicted MFS family arabinose efflux permease
MLSGIYNGLGMSIGSLIGGQLSKKYGITKTFMIGSKADTIVLFLYGAYVVLNSFHSKKQNKKE